MAVEIQRSNKVKKRPAAYPSLFGADSDEECLSDSASDSEDQARPSLLPLSEVIREAPRSLAGLLEVLLPRLQPRREVRGVALDDQKSFVSILVGELASQFSLLHRQINDPFLNPHQNRTLHTQVVVQVCKSLEELYGQYLSKAARLGESEGVFNHAANLSRLRAQLTVQANKSLNIPAIRRRVLEQLRSQTPAAASGSLARPPPRLPPIPPHELRRNTLAKPDLNALLLDEPLRSKMARFGVRLESGTVRRRIQRLQARVPAHPHATSDHSDSEEGELEGGNWEQVDAAETPEHSQDKPRQFPLHRVASMPELWGDFIPCDVGLITRQQRLERLEPKWRLWGVHRQQSVDSVMDLKFDVIDTSVVQENLQLGEYSQADLAADLRELLCTSVDHPQQQTQTSSSSQLTSATEDLHPLLQAHVHGLSAKHSRRLAAFELQERERLLGQSRPASTACSRHSSLGERSIPSVATLDQLPYLDIHVEHASGSSSQVGSGSSRPAVSSGGRAASGTPVFGGPGSVSPLDGSEYNVVGEEVNDNANGGGGGGDSMALLAASGSRLQADPLVDSGFLHLQQQQQQQQLVSPRLHHRLVESGHLDSGHHFTLQDISSASMLQHVHQQQQLHIRQASSGLMSDGQHAGVGDFIEGQGLGSQVIFEETDDAHSSSANLSHHKQPAEFDDTFSSAFSLDSSTKDRREVDQESCGDAGEVVIQAQPQPSVITTRINEKDVVRTSDIRVSERTPLNALKLKPYDPIYNELSGELDSSQIEELDSNLCEGKEITLVYDEILKTLSTEHLQFESEPVLEQCIEQAIELSDILASDTLHHRRSRRVINPALYRPIGHPWGQHTSRKEWEKSNQYTGPELHHLQQHHGKLKLQGSAALDPELTHQTRAYTTWLNWWRTTIDSEDYLKFASKEESDYLRLVYHLYDSDGSDSEAEEEERERKLRLADLRANLKAKELRRQQRYQEKSRFESGLWNVNTVVMGGLGGDPEICSSDEDEGGHENIKTGPINHQEVQQHLKQIWSRLHFPEAQQMDMAIKYSSHRLATQLNQALDLWGEACALIEIREDFLSRLERFEKQASDPSRFFAKGQRGSSVVRFEEARTRDNLHQELDKMDKEVSKVIKKLQVDHGDIVTYRGRPYCDKMSLDRTEMLYWLQQERRQAVLTPAVKTFNSGLLTTSTPTFTNL